MTWVAPPLGSSESTLGRPLAACEEFGQTWHNSNTRSIWSNPGSTQAMMKISVINHGFLLSVGLLLCLAGSAYAQCKSDSGERYRSDVESCNDRYSSPDEGADLRSCIENAYQDFAESYDDCDSTAPFYEEWGEGLSRVWSRMTGWLTGGGS